MRGYYRRHERIKRFQFHIGAIKIYDRTQKRFNLFVFQFHIGAIKIRLLHNAGSGRYKFQFHIGAIKISSTPSCFIFLYKFQFHIGAIKIKAPADMPEKLPRFNSILVRLKSIIIFVID